MIGRGSSLMQPTLHRMIVPSLFHKYPSFKPRVRKKSSSTSTGKHDSFFITTPIFYVNAQPHIGHLHSALLADAMHRFQLLKKGNIATIFSTGTDEHGLKIQQAAAKRQIPTLELCNEVSVKFKDLFDAANISYTDYVRTVENRHATAVQKFFQTVVERNHIYRGSYSGWYCVSDEAFLTDLQVKEITKASGVKEMVSVESGHPVEWSSEENYMFRLSDFQEDLKYWLRDDERVQPKRFLEELRNWLADELIDLSVSRSKERVSWGIPVPGDDNHVIYVWVDALVNYLTVAGYPDLRVWPPDLQLLGKDILRFHGIYWPALLIAAGLEPPRKLLCHSHWTVDGQKMSKSLGNMVCPFDRTEKFTADGLRYILLRGGTPHSDSNWNDERLIRMLNAEIADSLGNLLNRCTAPSLNPKQEFPSLNLNYLDRISLAGKELITNLVNLPDEVEQHYNDFNFYKGVNAVMATVRSANVFVDEQKPWELKKLEDRTNLDSILRLALETVRVAGIALQPITPSLSSKLLDNLGVSAHSRSWYCLKGVFSKEHVKSLCSTSKLGTRNKLFQKVKV